MHDNNVLYYRNMTPTHNLSSYHCHGSATEVLTILCAVCPSAFGQGKWLLSCSSTSYSWNYWEKSWVIM